MTSNPITVIPVITNTLSSPNNGTLSPKSAEIMRLRQQLELEQTKAELMAARIQSKDTEKLMMEQQLLMKTNENQKLTEVIAQERLEKTGVLSDSEADDDDKFDRCMPPVRPFQMEPSASSGSEISFLSGSAPFVGIGESASSSNSLLSKKLNKNSRRLSVKDAIIGYFQKDKTQDEIVIIKEGSLDQISSKGFRQKRYLRFIKYSDGVHALEVRSNRDLITTVKRVDVLTMRHSEIEERMGVTADDNVLTIITSMGMKLFFAGSGDALADWKFCLTGLIEL